MGELRLYAVGITEVRQMFGAPAPVAAQLRQIAATALQAPEAMPQGRIHRFGPIFRRVPSAPVIPPDQPTPNDLEVLLAGAYVPNDRLAATWRALETLVGQTCWGATSLSLTQQSLDDLDFALARGGVSSAVGLGHLLSSPTEINLLPLPGLLVGYHPHPKVLAMNEAYHAAMPYLENAEQHQLVESLLSWLDGFTAWAQAASQAGRTAPDLLGFWSADH